MITATRQPKLGSHKLPARTKENRFARPRLGQVGLERHGHKKAEQDLQVASLGPPGGQKDATGKTQAHAAVYQRSLEQLNVWSFRSGHPRIQYKRRAWLVKSTDCFLYGAKFRTAAK